MELNWWWKKSRDYPVPPRRGLYGVTHTSRRKAPPIAVRSAFFGDFERMQNVDIPTPTTTS
ncbi:uncharacterized protein H6S33_009764 [Morchella sextelata]|uniref:uncharacterized protein n=1 Tax=Morchella sextelata TaxID=1174677 RepID=UPI001D04CFAA|nr:uncharacterized protein H6S33_009764 [Morchella sextelata]KAH0613384.1 hypothetical protein H6S33_009764 [Morchella sextelata]